MSQPRSQATENHHARNEAIRQLEKLLQVKSITNEQKSTDHKSEQKPESPLLINWEPLKQAILRGKNRGFGTKIHTHPTLSGFIPNIALLAATEQAVPLTENTYEPFMGLYKTYIKGTSTPPIINQNLYKAALCLLLAILSTEDPLQKARCFMLLAKLYRQGDGKLPQNFDNAKKCNELARQLYYQVLAKDTSPENITRLSKSMASNLISAEFAERKEDKVSYPLFAENFDATNARNVAALYVQIGDCLLVEEAKNYPREHRVIDATIHYTQAQAIVGKLIANLKKGGNNNLSELNDFLNAIQKKNFAMNTEIASKLMEEQVRALAENSNSTNALNLIYHVLDNHILSKFADINAPDPSSTELKAEQAWIKIAAEALQKCIDKNPQNPAFTKIKTILDRRAGSAGISLGNTLLPLWLIYNKHFNQDRYQTFIVSLAANPVKKMGDVEILYNDTDLPQLSMLRKELSQNLTSGAHGFTVDAKLGGLWESLAEQNRVEDYLALADHYATQGNKETAQMLYRWVAKPEGLIPNPNYLAALSKLACIDVDKGCVDDSLHNRDQHIITMILQSESLEVRAEGFTFLKRLSAKSQATSSGNPYHIHIRQFDSWNKLVTNPKDSNTLVKLKEYYSQQQHKSATRVLVTHMKKIGILSEEPSPSHRESKSPQPLSIQLPSSSSSSPSSASPPVIWEDKTGIEQSDAALELKEANQVLTNRLIKQNKTIEQLRAKRQETLTLTHTLKIESTRATQTLQTLQLAHDRLVADKNTLNEEIKQLRDELSTQTSEAKESSHEQAEIISSLNLELSEIKKQLQEANKQLADTKGELTLHKQLKPKPLTILRSPAKTAWWKYGLAASGFVLGLLACATGVGAIIGTPLLAFSVGSAASFAVCGGLLTLGCVAYTAYAVHSDRIAQSKYEISLNNTNTPPSPPPGGTRVVPMEPQPTLARHLEPSNNYQPPAPHSGPYVPPRPV
jgi:hypothetical protein